MSPIRGAPGPHIHTLIAGSGDPAYRDCAGGVVGRVPSRGGVAAIQSVCELSGLEPKARLISAWGIAPGILIPPNLCRAPTARFIAFDKYLLGAAMSCSGNLARAFSPHFVFRFVTWGLAPGWFEVAPLALMVVIGSLRRPELRIRTHF